jgi:histidine phosphotransferase ChpT
LPKPPIRPLGVPHELSWLEFGHVPGSITQLEGNTSRMPTVPSPGAAACLPGLDPITLAGTICARLCHDLAGSVGALTGTLELAVEENDREALALAMVLSKELAARLRLLRAAWGVGSETPSPETLFDGLPGAERLRLEAAALQATAPETLRLSLSLLLAAAAGLPRGGTITLSGTDQLMHIELQGTRAAWPSALAECLDSEAALLAACQTPRSAAIALACLQARAQHRALKLDAPGRLSIAQL